MDEFDAIDIQAELRLIVNALAKAIGPDIRSYLQVATWIPTTQSYFSEGILSTQTFGTWWLTSAIVLS